MMKASLGQELLLLISKPHIVALAAEILNVDQQYHDCKYIIMTNRYTETNTTPIFS